MIKKILVVTIICLSFVTLWTLETFAANMCVDPGGGGDYTDLQAALTAAQNNYEPDTIKVAQGTYTGNYTYNSDHGYGIILLGDYVPGSSCGENGFDPEDTILTSASSGASVLYLENSDGGFIWVSRFTIQNGNATEKGGGVYARSYSSANSSDSVTIHKNIIMGNTSGANGGGVYAVSSSAWGAGGNVSLIGNTITGNTSTNNYGGGVYASAYGGNPTATAGKITFTSNTILNNSAGTRGGGLYADNWGFLGADGIILTNNIIVENYAIGDGGGVYIHGSSPGEDGDITVTNNTISKNNILQNASSGIYVSYGSKIFNCYNNIIWNNTLNSGGTMDIYLSGTGTANGFNNDYSTMTGSSWTSEGSNADFDPLFAGSSDYHLTPASACVNAGLNSAPEIPDYDFEDDPRIKNSLVDIGADEFVPATIPHILLLLLE